MTTTPDQLQALVAAALAGRTDAGTRVYTPRTWPIKPANLPAILVRMAGSDKVSLGKGDVQFTVTDTLQISIQVAKLATGDDTAILEAEADGWRMQRQAEVAIINSPDLTSRIQQFPFVRTRVGRNSDGQQTLVEMHTELGLEYYQGPEDFGGVYEGGEVVTEPLPDLAEVRIDLDQPAGADTGPTASAITLT